MPPWPERPRKPPGTRPWTMPSGIPCKGKNRATRPRFPSTGSYKSAMTYFPAVQYHRRHGLHFCVRDGNRCFPAPIFTDNAGGWLSPATRPCWFAYIVAEDLNVSQPSSASCHGTTSPTLMSSGTMVGMVKSLTVSTASLNEFRRLHVRPINPVVFRGSQSNVHLEVGFPLRCFQRLSLPYLATQRWTERSNWLTRGTSFPVLSY